MNCRPSRARLPGAGRRRAVAPSSIFRRALTRLMRRMATIHLSLDPQQEAPFVLTVGCERDIETCPCYRFNDARSEAESDLERYKAWSCHLDSSNEQ